MVFEFYIDGVNSCTRFGHVCHPRQCGKAKCFMDELCSNVWAPAYYPSCSNLEILLHGLNMSVHV